MDFFVIQTIKKIKGLTSRKHKSLWNACDKTSKAINGNKPIDSTSSVTVSSPKVSADTYFRPFQIACRTKNAKVISAALDYMQKLIAYGYLAEDSYVTHELPGTNKKLIDSEMFKGIQH